MFSWIGLFLQTSLFYLVPTLLGRMTVRNFFSKHFSENPLDWFVYFILGVGQIFGLAWLFRYGFNLSLAPIYFILLAGMSLVGLWWSLVIDRPKLGLSWSKLGIVLVLLLASITSYGLWSYQSQLPLNWDWFQHQTLATIIQTGNFSYFASDLSDTFGFNSYPPIFHLLISLAQYPLKLTPVYVMNWWAAVTFWHVVSLVIAGFALGYGVSKKWFIGVVCGLLSVLVFDSTISITTFSLLPQSMAALMTITTLSWIFGLRRYELKQRLGLLFGLIPIMVLTHYLVGFIGAALVAAALIYRLYLYNQPLRIWLSTVLLGLMVAGLLFKPEALWSTLNRGEASNFSLSLPQVLESVERSYGYLIYLLVPMGVINVLVRRERFGGLLSLFLIGLTVIGVSAIPYALKTMTITRFFMAIFIAFGIDGVLNYVSFKLTKIFGVLMLMISLSIILAMNITLWKGSLWSKGFYTHVGIEEIKVAEAIQNLELNSHNIQIISDPATQFVIEGLSGADSPGGAYMDQDLRKQLIESLKSWDGEKLTNVVANINDPVNPNPDETLIILSGRTFTWLTMETEDQMSFGKNIWTPQDLSLGDKRTINLITDSELYEPLYQGDSLAVIRLKKLIIE